MLVRLGRNSPKHAEMVAEIVGKIGVGGDHPGLVNELSMGAATLQVVEDLTDPCFASAAEICGCEIVRCHSFPSSESAPHSPEFMIPELIIGRDIFRAGWSPAQHPDN